MRVLLTWGDRVQFMLADSHHFKRYAKPSPRWTRTIARIARDG
jgi:hypothetical protein